MKKKLEYALFAVVMLLGVAVLGSVGYRLVAGGDPLARDLAKLYKADKSTDKAKQVGALRGVYAAFSADQALDGFATTGALLNAMKARAHDAGIPVDALSGVRHRLAAELRGTLGATDRALDEPTRTAALAAFQHVAAALSTLK